MTWIWEFVIPIWEFVLIFAADIGLKIGPWAGLQMLITLIVLFHNVMSSSDEVNSKFFDVFLKSVSHRVYHAVFWLAVSYPPVNRDLLISHHVYDLIIGAMLIHNVWVFHWCIIMIMIFANTSIKIKKRQCRNIILFHQYVACFNMFKEVRWRLHVELDPQINMRLQMKLYDHYLGTCDKDTFLLCTGTAIVTESKAALWTDGRYFLQAEKQLDSNWTLMKTGDWYMVHTPVSVALL